MAIKTIENTLVEIQEKKEKGEKKKGKRRRKK